MYFVENHKQYSDFNTLSLYRSLLENKLLSVKELMQIRNFANIYFQKAFDFLQLKDPDTYLKVLTLGEDITEQEEKATLEKSKRKVRADTER